MGRAHPREANCRGPGSVVRQHRPAQQDNKTGRHGTALHRLHPHRLGKAEATRRLQAGLSTVRDRFSRHITITEEVWTGAHLDFRIAALGQSAAGTLEVADDAVHLSVQLPFMLDLIARKAKDVIQKQGRILLEKK